MDIAQAGAILGQEIERVFVRLYEDRAPAALVNQGPGIGMELSIPGTEFHTPALVHAKAPKDFRYNSVLAFL
ncbi:hypothetical protein [Enhydrobacter aerosaccus]|uniref:hypothetical protein n=1 Tax=Enhydrobacter aerosaccus TaxID=225324 RepID=UPI001482DFDE|nr:hypothetical protein [Enhydrobacter aerosaccus]